MAFEIDFAIMLDKRSPIYLYPNNQLQEWTKTPRHLGVPLIFPCFNYLFMVITTIRMTLGFLSTRKNIPQPWLAAMGSNLLGNFPTFRFVFNGFYFREKRKLSSLPLDFWLLSLG